VHCTSANVGSGKAKLVAVLLPRRVKTKGEHPSSKGVTSRCLEGINPTEWGGRDMGAGGKWCESTNVSFPVNQAGRKHDIEGRRVIQSSGLTVHKKNEIIRNADHHTLV